MKQHTPVFFGIVLICLTSCSSKIQPAAYIDLKSALTVSIDTTNSLTGVTNNSKRTIQPTSQTYQKLVEWLDSNPNGWQNSFASYTVKVSVTQKNFRLLYHPDFVIIGFEGKDGKAQQYTKKITKGALGFLTENAD